MFGKKVYDGRWTGRSDEPFVVLIIGFRINKFRALARWMWTGMSMGPMLRELATDPSKGYLGGETFLYWRGVAFVQYWRSFDALEAYGREKGGLHARTWGQYNERIGNDGSVGIWHETYLIEPNKYEGVYGNMPRFGMGAAMEHVPATGKLETARQRLGGQNEPLFESPPTPIPAEKAERIEK